MKDAASKALEALGHMKIANPRCEARYKDAEHVVPGPRNRPVWCDLDKGHDGPHRHISGHHWLTMDRESLIEMKPLSDICQKCRTHWPCKDAETVMTAIAN